MYTRFGVNPISNTSCFNFRTLLKLVFGFKSFVQNHNSSHDFRPGLIRLRRKSFHDFLVRGFYLFQFQDDIYVPSVIDHFSSNSLQELLSRYTFGHHKQFNSFYITLKSIVVILVYQHQDVSHVKT